MLVRKYIPRDATVLELGARYGTVSCVISQILDTPRNHVAVEPDPSVTKFLRANRDNNGGKFQVFEGAVSRQKLQLGFIDPKFDLHEYGTFTRPSDTGNIPVKTLEEFDLEFDCVVADCEGFFPTFVEENPDAIKKMRVIIYEQDGSPWKDFAPKYLELDKVLGDYGFSLVETIPHPKYENNPRFHNVWLKRCANDTCVSGGLGVNDELRRSAVSADRYSGDYPEKGQYTQHLVYQEGTPLG